MNRVFRWVHRDWEFSRTVALYLCLLLILLPVEPFLALCTQHRRIGFRCEIYFIFIHVIYRIENGLHICVRVRVCICVLAWVQWTHIARHNIVTVHISTTSRHLFYELLYTVFHLKCILSAAIQTILDMNVRNIALNHCSE